MTPPHQDGTAPQGDRPAVLAALPPGLLRATVISACVLLIAVSVWLFSALVVRLTIVVVPLLVGLLTAAVLQPLAARLRHPRLPDWVGPLVLVLGTLVVLAGTLAVTGNRVASELPQLREQAGQLRQDLNRRTGLSLPEVDDSSVAGGADEAVGVATEILVGLILALALAFLFLKDGERMWVWLVQRAGPGIRDEVDLAGRAAWSTLAVYVRGLTVVALFDALAIGIGLVVLGVPLVLTLVVLQFIGSYVPTFGALVAGAVAVAVALLDAGLAVAALTLALVVVVQQVGNNVIEPWIMGRTLPLHPAVVLLAVTSGAVLWGIAGAFLFVPLAAAGVQAVHAVRESRAPRPDEVTARSA